MLKEYFLYDSRLGISVPSLQKDLDQYSQKSQQSILFRWERIRGRIPDRISELEQEITQKLTELSDEHDFMRSCRLNNEIAELASIINDLWIWYRTHDEVNDVQKMYQ